MPETASIIWTPEFEMEHWNGIKREKHFSDLQRKHQTLQVAALAPHDPHIVISVGGGRWAGDLRLYQAGRSRVLVDPLVEQFHDVPEGVEKVPAFARAIPMPSNMADVVFCLEALDHCNDRADLEASIQELQRITKPGGMIFFQMPVRFQPRLGHPIARNVVSCEAVIGMFTRCQLLLSTTKPMQDHDEVWIAAEKLEAWD